MKKYVLCFVTVSLSVGFLVLLAHESFHSSSFGKIIFDLSSRTRRPELKNQAARVVEQSEQLYKLLIQQDFDFEPKIAKTFKKVELLCGRLLHERESVGSLKIRDVRAINRALNEVQDLAAQAFSIPFLSVHDRQSLTFLVDTLHDLRGIVLNPQELSTVSKKDAIVDTVYHRPIEWVAQSRIAKLPGELYDAFLRFIGLRDEQTREVWSERKTNGAGMLNIIEYGPVKQLRSHDQFSAPVRTLCGSSTFCGGLSVSLLSPLLQYSSLPTLARSVKDFTHLQKTIPEIQKRTARMRVDALAGKSNLAGTGLAIEENGKKVEEWLRDALDPSSEKYRRLGNAVVDLIFENKLQIAAGLTQWLSKENSNQVSNRQRLVDIVDTDWHLNTEVEALTAGMENVTVIDDVSIESYEVSKDIFSYLLTHNRMLYEKIFSSIERDPFSFFVQQPQARKVLATLWSKIHSLRTQGRAQGLIIRFPGHWISGKIERTKNGRYIFYLVDTLNVNRTQDAIVRMIYELFTRQELPKRELFDYYIDFSLYESALRILVKRQSDIHRSRSEQEKAYIMYGKVLNSFLELWLQFEKSFGQALNRSYFDQVLSFIYQRLMVEHSLNKSLKSIKLLNRKGDRVRQLSLDPTETARDFVNRYSNK